MLLGFAPRLNIDRMHAGSESGQERRAEAGELLGLQRLYVTTALSNQPRGQLSKPPEVHA